MKHTLQLLFVCHIKNLKEPIDQHFCAGLLVLGKAQKHTPVLKNYCIIIRLANGIYGQMLIFFRSVPVLF